MKMLPHPCCSVTRARNSFRPLRPSRFERSDWNPEPQCRNDILHRGAYYGRQGRKEGQGKTAEAKSK